MNKSCIQVNKLNCYIYRRFFLYWSDPQCSRPNSNIYNILFLAFLKCIDGNRLSKSSFCKFFCGLLFDRNIATLNMCLYYLLHELSVLSGASAVVCGFDVRFCARLHFGGFCFSLSSYASELIEFDWTQRPHEADTIYGYLILFSLYYIGSNINNGVIFSEIHRYLIEYCVIGRIQLKTIFLKKVCRFESFVFDVCMHC